MQTQRHQTDQRQRQSTLHPAPRRPGVVFAIALTAITGLALALTLTMSGCSGSSLGGGASDPLKGAQNYQLLCASCHGPVGKGGSGPALNPWTQGESTLLHRIEGSMPKGAPERCDQRCAEDLTAYILGGFRAEPVNCEAAQATPRKLRLLTRREYNNTVRDLFYPSSSAAAPPPAGGSCQTDAQCSLEHESCVGGACVADPCNLRTFLFPANGKKYGGIYVAGSFNGWPSSPPGAEWQMTYVPEMDAYVLKHSLVDNNYTYKFVVDGSWTTDPVNPKGQDDGYGGKNSVLDVSCAGQGANPGVPADWNPARDFPAESRPTGYAFDTSDAGLVTSVHLEQYMLAAESLATTVAKQSDLVPCAGQGDAQACAADFAGRFGRRAFRRPLTAAEINRYQKLITSQPDFSAGVRLALQVMLTSPHFLYRFELGSAQADGTFKLSPYELASALSYLFWGSMPDEPLLAAAEKGDLARPDGLEAQARRLLADPRSREIVGTFALQWLGVDELLALSKDSALFPAFDDQLRGLLAEETRAFVTHVVFDGSKRYEELLTADYTFANDKLASLYGLPQVSGSALQRVPTSSDRKAGLLGQGSVLATYAKSDRTSPIKRGIFVRQHLLCEDLGAPPPNVPALPPVDPNATLREQFKQHTAVENCRSCHQYIDTVGFGFEHFDAIGRYRTTEGNNLSIDANGDMNDVEAIGSNTSAPFSTLPALSTILAGSKAAKSCFSQQYYRFARGHREEGGDLCALRDIESRFEQSGYDIQELMVAIVLSPAFAVRGP